MKFLTLKVIIAVIVVKKKKNQKESSHGSVTELGVYGTINSQRESITPSPQEEETQYKGIAPNTLSNVSLMESKPERKVTKMNVPRDAWEINESELEIKEQIGKGGFDYNCLFYTYIPAFGVVYKATWRKITGKS